MGERITKIYGIVFIGILVVMYGTNLGIPGIAKYDAEFQLLDMQFGYSYVTVATMLERIGKQGIEHYLLYFMVDFLFILCLMLLQERISDRLSLKPDGIKSNGIKMVLLGFTVARAVFDLAEDMLLALMMKEVLPFTQSNVAISSACTRIKFAMLFLWAVLAGGLMVHKVFLRRKIPLKHS